MEIHLHKAQFRPGETIRIDLTPAPGATTVGVTIQELHREVAAFTAEPGEPILWIAPADRSWAAYGVDAVAYNHEGTALDEGHTAFDVADCWYRSPRLGFMTDFNGGETLTETQRRIDLLQRLHVNCLHFYDWFYTHHSYMPPEENFVDSMGRELSLIAVRRKIRLAQRAGMAALAYGPLYAAEESFVAAHPDWALYRMDGVPFNVARLFYIMDFRPHSPWTAHILREYQRSIAELGFDGIHLDQYGYPKQALPYPGQAGQRALDLSEWFLPFIEQAYEAVQRAKPGAQVVFHAVNNWPIRKVAQGPQAINYIQVFPPHDTYRDLRDLVAGARLLAPEKPVVLAAYLKPFAADTPERAEVALRLLTAVVHVAGGYHVVHGEGEGVLTEGYFPNYARLRPQGLRVMQAYLDFALRYGPLLHAPPESDVSETHAGGVTEVYSFSQAPTSSLPRPGTVWTVIREHGDLVSINLVNLTGTATGFWNEGQTAPASVQRLTVTCRVVEPIAAVYAASPERNGGAPLRLAFAVESDPHTGHLLRFEVPAFDYWSLILIVPGA